MSARFGPNMNPNQSPIANRLPPTRDMEKPCRHPRVRIVAREPEADYMECLECGDIFDSHEIQDMAIEETTPPEEA